MYKLIFFIGIFWLFFSFNSFAMQGGDSFESYRQKIGPHRLLKKEGDRWVPIDLEKLPHERTPINILGIDGGGVKGIGPAVILEDIETRTGKRICELFDLIAGTSTGGILSLGLVKKESSKNPHKASAMVAFYRSLASNIFPPTRDACRVFNVVTKGYVYAAMPFEKALKEVLGEYKLSDLQTPTLVTAVDIRTAQVKIFRSYKGQTTKNRDFFLRDIARATSAANPFFPTVHISHPTGYDLSLLENPEETLKENILYVKSIADGRLFYTVMNPVEKRVNGSIDIKKIKGYKHDPTNPLDLKKLKPFLSCILDEVEEGHIDKPPVLSVLDGGYAANNPSVIALAEAFDLFGKRPVNLISIGTGRPDYLEREDPAQVGTLRQFLTLINILFETQSQAVDHNIERLSHHSSVPINYIRMQPHVPAEFMDLEGAHNIATLEDIARKWCKSGIGKSLLNNVQEALMASSSMRSHL